METNPDSRPIALVGLMGAGKSTVARALGERLGGAVADLDAMVEAERGCSVAELFEREGEPAFRRLEGRILEQALAAGAGIIACGGGIVLDPEHRRLLATRCRVVWLEVSPAAAALRVASARDSRPLLAAGPEGETLALLQRLGMLLAQRRPLYEQVAQARVPVEGRTADEVADEVLRVLGRRAG
jgi:shikimate kinase